MVKKKLNLKEWIRQERKRLYKGCGGFESYWGHKCKSTFVNKSGKKVIVYCDKCRAELDYLKRLSKGVRILASYSRRIT